MAKQQPKNNMPQLPRFNIFWIYGIIAAFIIGWSLLSQENGDPVKGDWPMVEQMVEQGEVERIRRDKADKRGGFDQRIFLESVTD